MSFVGLARREPATLAFGLLYTLAATVGQTFIVSLFLPGIKASLMLDEAQVSLLFTVATLASALALWKVGAWIDRTDLLRYAAASAVLLALACALMAAAPALPLLAAGLFCLRLAGNGLMTHIAVTATVRYFVADRGRALAIVFLGSSLGEAALPAAVIPLIAVAGWRWALAGVGLAALALALVGAYVVRCQHAFRAPPPSRPERVAPAVGAVSVPPRRSDRRYFLLTAPLFAAMWVFTTAAIFHQSLLAEAKGLTLRHFALSFVAFALVRVPVSVVTGRLVDRLGSSWLFCVHLVPLAGGTVALIVSDAAWIPLAYWLGAGVTSGMGTVLQSTVVAERVPRERLGHARSVLGAAGIVASAVGPTLYGYAYAAGAGVVAILWASVAFFACATLLGVMATRTPAAVS